MEADNVLNIVGDKDIPEEFTESTFEQLLDVINSQIDTHNRYLKNHNIKSPYGQACKLSIASNIVALTKQQYILIKKYKEHLQEQANQEVKT